MVKLSKAQAEVIRLMKEGWELHRDRTFAGSSSLVQKGKSFQWKNISSATWYRLYKLGLITTKPELQFPTEIWFLTEEGKNASTSN